MKLLYSNILPLRIKDDNRSFQDFFTEAANKSDIIDVAVGYVSKASLAELQKIISNSTVIRICLIIGMYYLEGMPEGIYHAAMSLNAAWQKAGIGEVKLVKAFKYHGKLYSFFKEGLPVAGIIGSHNLGALKLEASNLRQYEISSVTEVPEEVNEISSFINMLKQPSCSVNINSINNIPLIRDINRALVDQEYVTKITQDEVQAYTSKTTDISFEIPLKVPANRDDLRMRGSNINVCYASGRKRVWWENEMVVDKEIRDLPGYPEYQKPFMAVTDDGWKFQVWTCGQDNKNLYSKDDLKIMGRWIKGRLVATGLVEPINNVNDDTAYDGLITEEMLDKYGRRTITLTKTSLKTITGSGIELDVWMLSFLPKAFNAQEAED